MELCIVGAMEWPTPMPTRWRVFLLLDSLEVMLMAALGDQVSQSLSCLRRVYQVERYANYFSAINGFRMMFGLVQVCKGSWMASR